jgi:hypothetical protein
MNARLFIVLFTMSTAALAAAGWRAQTLAGHVRSAQVTLEESKKLAGRIVAQRDAPETATAARRSEEELSQRIESWSRGAGIDARQLVRIDPLSPRRVGDTDYLVEGADIELAEVTLPQLAMLASAVARDDQRLTVSQLRLTTPRSSTAKDTTEETWRVELALTYLRYSPKSRAKG